MWIETRYGEQQTEQHCCHTLRGCVDWNCCEFITDEVNRSHTLRGCVDWNRISRQSWTSMASHPAWVCGLKPWNLLNQNTQLPSHPAWVCGLKLRPVGRRLCGDIVTPCVGVWIETLANYLSLPQEIVTPCVGVWIETYKQGWQYYFTWMSHPAWVCGLKHDTAYIEKEKEGHTLRGCVDWNPWNGYFYKGLHCHTLRGCVDWNYGWCYEFYGISSHTLRGCVDWNLLYQ